MDLSRVQCSAFSFVLTSSSWISLARKRTRQVDLLRFVAGGAPSGTAVECPHFETEEEKQAIRDRMTPSQQRRASGGGRGGGRGRCVDHDCDSSLCHVTQYAFRDTEVKLTLIVGDILTKYL